MSALDEAQKAVAYAGVLSKMRSRVLTEVSQKAALGHAVAAADRWKRFIRLGEDVLGLVRLVAGHAQDLGQAGGLGDARKLVQDFGEFQSKIQEFHKEFLGGYGELDRLFAAWNLQIPEDKDPAFRDDTRLLVLADLLKQLRGGVAKLDAVMEDLLGDGVRLANKLRQMGRREELPTAEEVEDLLSEVVDFRERVTSTIFGLAKAVVRRAERVVNLVGESVGTADVLRLEWGWARKVPEADLDNSFELQAP